jgi:hypothetical protein
MQYGLYRIEDDSTTTLVSEHDDLLTGIAAGNYAVDIEDFDFAYCLQGTDGVRVATFREGRIGYREWAIRSGRLAGDYIHSLDDKYDHDVDVAMSR